LFEVGSHNAPFFAQFECGKSVSLNIAVEGAGRNLQIAACFHDRPQFVLGLARHMPPKKGTSRGPEDPDGAMVEKKTLLVKEDV
jgi:hypothetical protein